MKKKYSNSIFITIVIIFMCTFAKACADDNGNGIQSGDYHFTAKVNGVSFISIEEEMAAVHQDEYLVITGGTSNAEEIITLQFFDFPGNTGVYNIGSGEYDTHCFYSNDSESFFVFDDDPLSSGTLNITKISAQSIEGTFSFTGVTNNGQTTMEVTDGSFHVPVFSTP